MTFTVFPAEQQHGPRARRFDPDFCWSVDRSRQLRVLPHANGLERKNKLRPVCRTPGLAEFGVLICVRRQPEPTGVLDEPGSPP
jgi:hypothetical protein